MTWKKSKSSISGEVIIDGSIETEQLADDTVTFAKLSGVKDEDDMASDSASHIATQQSIKAYVDNREIEAHAANNNVTQNLTTSTTTVWTDFDTPGYSEDRLHTARFEFRVTSGSSTYRNDFNVYVTVVNPSAQTAYSLGTATYESAPAQYGRIISFSGDITDKLTAGGSIGLNLDSSGYFADRTVESYYYDNGDDKTYLRYNSYPSDIVSSGSPVEVFFDPFHWATNGTSLILEDYHLELPYTSQNGVFTVETRLGYFSDSITYRLQAREINTGDSITINTLRHTLTTRKI